MKKFKKFENWICKKLQKKVEKLGGVSICNELKIVFLSGLSTSSPYFAKVTIGVVWREGEEAQECTWTVTTNGKFHLDYGA